MSRLLSLAGVALLACSSHAAAAIPVTQIDRDGSIAVRVEVDYGLLDSCEAREIPHIIEHLVLAETRYGRTPADLIEALNKQGVRITAVTRQDFTEYTFEGTRQSAAIIQDAVLQTLGRASLPENSLAREVSAIHLETGSVGVPFPQAHPFEPWAYTYIPGSPAPCPSLGHTPDYSFPKVAESYQQHYGEAAFSLTVVAPAGTFDGAKLAEALEAARPGGVAKVPGAPAEVLPLPPVTQLEALKGEPAFFELLIAIPGRKTLPSIKAREAAESVRLAIQSKLRVQPAAYTAKSVIHQSNSAGWISVTAYTNLDEVGSLSEEMRETAQQAYRDSLNRPAMLDLVSNRELAESPTLHGNSWQYASAKSMEIGVEFRFRDAKQQEGWPWVMTAGISVLIIWAILTRGYLLRRSGARVKTPFEQMGR